MNIQPDAKFALLGFCFLSALTTCQTAVSQDVEVEIVVEDEEVEEVVADVAVAAVAQPVWTDAQFDQWVFQNHRTAAAAKKHMLAQLTLQTDDVNRACKLTESQRKKIQLAGRGDIKRFFDKYEVVKKKFQRVKNDQQKFNQIWQDISPLQLTMQSGLFHQESFMHKSLRNTLNKDQWTKYGSIAGDRRAFRHRAKIEMTVTLLEQGVAFTAKQREALIEFLIKETKPPVKSGQYDYYYILYQLSKVPEARMRKMLDETQWKVVTQQLQQGRAMERWLKQQGYIPEENEDAADPDVEEAAAEGDAAAF